MRRALAMLGAVLAASCGQSAGNTSTFGALVPLTGQLADEGPHINQALLLAGEELNRAGGVAGRPIRIQLRDTRSDPDRGLQVGLELLQDPSLLGLLGPEEDDIARGLLPTLKTQGLSEVSGGIISTIYSGNDDDGLVFRTCPSALVLGRALAQRILADGINRLAVLFVSSEYGRSLSGVIANELVGKAEIVAPGLGFQGPYAVEANRENYDDLLSQLRTAGVQAIVLVLPPVSGASVVRNWALSGSNGRLYFAPSLRTDSFLQSLPPGVADGLVGVSAAPGAESAAFADAFASSWYGTRPRPEAAFAYDGLALLALATEAAAHEAGGAPTRELIKAQLSKVSGPPGEAVRWNELARGLALARAGTDIDYVGASGSVSFDSVGDAPTTAEFWTIHGNQIISLGTAVSP